MVFAVKNCRGEFVATQPGDMFILANRFLERCGDHLQCFVTGLMAAAVVDILEIVEVDNDQSQA